MGDALSADSRHGSVDGLSDEPWVELGEARARSSCPAATTLRYHGQGAGSLGEDYDEVGSTLGQGASGAVVLALGRQDGRKYALKRFNKRAMKTESLKLLKREVEVYLSVDHPGIAKLCDVYECSEKLTLVMECCTGGELFERLLERDRCCLSEHEAASVSRQMLRAVSHLHAHSIVHRDLKLENFLFEEPESDVLKMIDFGFAKVWGPGMPLMHTCCGSLAYVSPDVLRGEGYTSKCDMWSLGVIAFMLLAGYAPFSGDARTMKGMIKAGSVDWGGGSNWHDVSPDAQDFVRHLLTRDPDARLDAATALSHPWLLRQASGTSPCPIIRSEVLWSMQQFACSSKLRRVALQLVAREMSHEETDELRAVFGGLSAECTGTICQADFVEAVRALRERATAGDGFWSYFSFWPSAVRARGGPQALQPSPSSARPVDVEKEAAELFRALDGNGDGEVYFSDFVAAALASRPTPPEGALRRAFARLDADRSGALGEADLRRALDGEGAPAAAGVPGHGELGFRDFARLLRGDAAPTSPTARAGAGGYVLARM